MCEGWLPVDTVAEGILSVLDEGELCGDAK
jgi:hypothetical protein